MKLNLLVIAMLGAALSVAIFHGDSSTKSQGSELNLVKTQQIQEHGDHSQPTSNEDTVAWKDDPVCQMVFFAVLEGLYSQGVSDEVVESIVGPKCDTSDADKMRERIKRSFVLECPLCQPTFEAFVAYQSRPRFSDGSNADNFGSGFEQSMKERLLSDRLQTRLEALKVFVQDCVSKKLAHVDMSEEEFADWGGRVMKRAQEGKQQLIGLTRSEESYQQWGIYWGCAACNGSRDAVQEKAAEATNRK